MVGIPIFRCYVSFREGNFMSHEIRIPSWTKARISCFMSFLGFEHLSYRDYPKWWSPRTHWKKPQKSVQSIILLQWVSSIPYAHDAPETAVFQAAPELARNFLKPLGISMVSHTRIFYWCGDVGWAYGNISGNVVPKFVLKSYHRPPRFFGVFCCICFKFAADSY